MLRRPLLHPETVMDCLDVSREQLNQLIQNGELPFAFNIGAAKSRTEPRILAHCVVEKQLGPIPGIGSMRNLGLAEVVNLILPKRDIRTTELRRLLATGNQWFLNNSKNFSVIQKAENATGPNSFAVLCRASVASFLEKRRII